MDQLSVVRSRETSKATRELSKHTAKENVSDSADLTIITKLQTSSKDCTGR